MRQFLFKIFWKLANFFAPDRDEMDKILVAYYNKLACKQRQKELDCSVRPRTETYEWLTDKRQRDIFLEGKRIRGASFSRGMRYTDHMEAVEYHDS